jgi:hypothetical protein
VVRFNFLANFAGNAVNVTAVGRNGTVVFAQCELDTGRRSRGYGKPRTTEALSVRATVDFGVGEIHDNSQSKKE